MNVAVFTDNDFDTAGNVVLEAQASGQPVLVSSDGGPRESVIAGRTGVICDAADPAEWAERATPWLMSAGRRAAAGQAAREYALTRRWDEALAPLYQAYRDAGRAGARPRPGGDAVIQRPPPAAASWQKRAG
jgi:glycosyltransferase involved in cell wall biosynthesis